MENDGYTAKGEDTASEAIAGQEADCKLWPCVDAGHVRSRAEAKLLSLFRRAPLDDMEIPCLTKVWIYDVIGIVPWGAC